MHRQHARKQGFTLIELAAVILILGVLTAVLLPTFLDTTDQAHDSAAAGINGAFATAVGGVRAQWLAEGGNATSVNYSGANIPVSMSGWPTPVAGTADCVDLMQGMLQNPPETVTWAAPFTTGDGLYAWTQINGFGSYCLYVYRPSYPSQLRVILYYADVPGTPQLSGRVMKFGF